MFSSNKNSHYHTLILCPFCKSNRYLFPCPFRKSLTRSVNFWSAFTSQATIRTLHGTTRQLSTQDPVDGATSIGPLSRSSGTCLLMEKVGPGGALRRRARTKLPSSCPVFWATRTMRWSHVSWRADKMRQAIKDTAWAMLNEGVGGTRSPSVMTEGVIDANLATKKRLQMDDWNRQFQRGPFNGNMLSFKI